MSEKLSQEAYLKVLRIEDLEYKIGVLTGKVDKLENPKVTLLESTVETREPSKEEGGAGLCGRRTVLRELLTDPLLESALGQAMDEAGSVNLLVKSVDGGIVYVCGTPSNDVTEGIESVEIEPSASPEPALGSNKDEIDPRSQVVVHLSSSTLQEDSTELSKEGQRSKDEPTWEGVWITDRPPTADDANRLGNVAIFSGARRYNYAHKSFISVTVGALPWAPVTKMSQFNESNPAPSPYDQEVSA